MTGATLYSVRSVFCVFREARRYIQKFPDWPPGARTANGTALCHCSQRVFIVVIVYFVIDSVRKLLDIPRNHTVKMLRLMKPVFYVV
jgi:hypothetical protein